MDKVLNQLKRRFIIVFMIVGGAFLLLAYGAIFVVNLTQTMNGIERNLNSVLDKTPTPFEEKDEWLKRSNCVILIRQNDLLTAFNADNLDNETLSGIIEHTVREGEESFSFNDKYFKATSRKIIATEIEVYAVYDWTEDRKDVIEAGVTTSLVYVLCLILLFVFGNMVAKQVVEPVKTSYEQQKKLVADASHELKTPIAIIGANMSLITSDPQGKIEDNEHWFQNIESQLKRMSALISDMLELHKADDAKSKPKTCEDISALLDGVLLSFEARCFEKNIQLTQNIQPDIKTLCIRQNIEKLYTIMMDNAFKYTPEGGKIDVSVTADKKSANIKFTNFGTGIAKEHTTKIFDRFYRIDNARTQNAQKGNSFGLGLSLAKSIVLDHEGSIVCNSDGNSYVTFDITLPVRTDKKHEHKNSEK